MYIHAAFRVSDKNQLHDFIEQNSFGLLLSQVDEKPFATHLPFLIERKAGPQGTLIGHMARANPQWRELEAQTALVVFSGPHAYISPTWYQAPHVVPTWNYTAVHVSGQAQLVEEREPLLNIVEATVRHYEATMPKPWSLVVDHAIDLMLKQIVGFRITIEKLEGKFKLNQNHPAERRAKVKQALREQPDENSQAIADLIPE